MAKRTTEDTGRVVTDDVFSALEFSEDEAANLQIRAVLMLKLRDQIKDMTQTRAAVELGVHQSEVSYLVNVRIDKFSIDKLVNILARTGRKVEVRVGSLAVA